MEKHSIIFFSIPLRDPLDCLSGSLSCLWGPRSRLWWPPSCLWDVLSFSCLWGPLNCLWGPLWNPLSLLCTGPHPLQGISTNLIWYSTLMILVGQREQWAMLYFYDYEGKYREKYQIFSISYSGCYLIQIIFRQKTNKCDVLCIVADMLRMCLNFQ